MQQYQSIFLSVVEYLIIALRASIDEKMYNREDES